MGPLGHMRIHESGVDRSLDTLSTSHTSTMPSPAHTPPRSVLTTASFTITITEADTDTADFSFPHCLRTFISRTDLVGHLRIHRTEAGESVPGAPTYSRRIRLHCPHFTRTFIRRMGLLGHMRVYENLR
ncbi:hypothetical protein SprV_0200734400 [Sparganum proliferum]